MEGVFSLGFSGCHAMRRSAVLIIEQKTQRISVFDAVRRSSIAEVLKVAEARQKTGNAGSAYPLYDNAFMDLRQTVGLCRSISK